jgi:hypothetical protein
VRDRLLRDGFLVLAVVFVALRLFQVDPWADSVDACAYWLTRDGGLYGAETTGRICAYVYAPAFAQLLWPVVQLPWPVFDALWTALNLAIYGWLVGRLALPLLLFLPFPFEIVSGNVHLLLAAMIVIGLRERGAWAWALGAITKATPLVGLGWFAVRREWRPLAIALGVTAAIVGVSFLLSPSAWAEWLGLLVRDAGRPLETVGWFLPIPVLPRLAAAVVVVAWGARTDRRWTIPVAVLLAMPVLWVNAFAVLAAVVPLTERGRRLAAWPDRRRRRDPATNLTDGAAAARA